MNTNRIPVLPAREHRPQSVNVLVDQLADVTNRLRLAEQALTAAEADLQRGEEIDADALVEALAAGKPEPESTLPMLRDRHERASNLVSALNRLRGDYRAKLNDTINAEARDGWAAKLLAEAEEAEAKTLAAAAALEVMLGEANEKRSLANWAASAKAGQVRDYSGRTRVRFDVVERAKVVFGVDAREMAHRSRLQKQEHRERVAAEEAEAEAIREARAARRAEQNAGEIRGRQRYLDELGRQGGTSDAA